MGRRIARFTPFVILLVFGAGAPARVLPSDVAKAQNPPDRQDEPRVELGAELVLLDVSVADRSGHPATALPKSRFYVTEDGVPQDIEFFSTAQAPASIAFVLDTSGSMRLKIRQTTEAATRILDGARPGDEFAVIEFKDTASLIEEFTSDTRDVRDALSGLDAVGQTAVLDAAYLAADYVQREGRNRLKAVVLVTDGLDRNSYYSFDQLADHLRKLDVRLYPIGLTTDLDVNGAVFRKSDKTKADDLLTKLARDTGGQAFFPAGLDGLSSVNDAIATDLRTVYSIGYYPKNSKKDNTFRAVAVKVLGANGKEDTDVTVRTRSGYVAERS